MPSLYPGRWWNQLSCAKWSALQFHTAMPVAGTTVGFNSCFCALCISTLAFLMLTGDYLISHCFHFSIIYCTKGALFFFYCLHAYVCNGLKKTPYFTAVRSICQSVNQMSLFPKTMRKACKIITH